MPNWCHNKLTVFGSEENVRHFFMAVRGESQQYAISEAELISTKGVVPERDRKIHDLSFHALVPIPDEVMKKTYDPSGYHAETTLWGVKWGPVRSSVEEENYKDDVAEVTYRFDTPWGVAHTFFAKASKMYPDLTFVISFAEESPSRGRIVFQNGIYKDISEEEHVTRYQAEMPTQPKDEDDDEEMRKWDEAYDLWHTAYLDTHEGWVAEYKGRYKIGRMHNG